MDKLKEQYTKEDYLKAKEYLQMANDYPNSKYNDSRGIDIAISMFEQLIKEHFELVELLKPHGYGMLSAEEFEHWISYICKHNADNDMIIMSQNEQLEQIKNPQPYKFEELHEGMWVWDDKEKECIYITKTFISISGFNVFTYLGIYQNLEELKKLDMLFEENRFYPVTKAMEYQE